MRKTDQDALLVSQGELLNIFYKNAEVDPSKDLTKLSQYASAYSVATIDKASEVSQLVKQKDIQIAIFEEQVAGDQQKLIQFEQWVQDA